MGARKRFVAFLLVLMLVIVLQWRDELRLPSRSLGEGWSRPWNEWFRVIDHDQE